MKTLTITFASKTDLQDALRQITKARDYAARGGQLGVLGQALLLNTLVRAKSIETGDHKSESEAFTAVKMTAFRILNNDWPINLKQFCDGILNSTGWVEEARKMEKDALETTKTTTKKKV